MSDVYVYMYACWFGPTTYCKFQMSTSNGWTGIAALSACVVVYMYVWVF